MHGIEWQASLLAHVGNNETKARSVGPCNCRGVFWIRDEFIANVHFFEKLVVFGHTPYQDIMEHLPFKLGIDTGLVYGNKLSCVELSEGKVFQIEQYARKVRKGKMGSREMNWSAQPYSSKAAMIG